ncbi:hypothetical protein ACOSQ2_004997 [Xanthoceras sorbifolium]
MMIAIFQGVVAENAGGDKNGTQGNVLGVPPGPEGIPGIGGSLTSGTGVMGGKIGVVGKGGSSRPGTEGKPGGVCKRRRAPKAAPMLENDKVIKKAKVIKREMAIANVLEQVKCLLDGYMLKKKERKRVCTGRERGAGLAFL